MTQEEIKTGNKLIAEFMGLIVIPAGTRAIGSIKYPEESEAFLKYNTDWNSLMPVVEKIENIIEPRKEDPSIKYTPYRIDIINRNMTEILKDGENAICSILSIHNSKIESVYKCVVKFIEWYNQQTK